MAHREDVIINGKRAPSVTQVLNVEAKEFLYRWYGKHGWAKCQEVLRESQEIGRRVHEAFESYFRGEGLPDLSQQEARMFLQFKSWALKTKFSPVELEHHVKSNIYGYHGTMDSIGYFDHDQEKLFVCDWKTSSMMDEMYGAQLAAYAQGYKEETGVYINEGIIVKVDKKKNKLETKMFTDLPRYFEVFKHCLGLWNFRHSQ